MGHKPPRRQLAQQIYLLLLVAHVAVGREAVKVEDVAGVFVVHVVAGRQDLPPVGVGL